MNYHIIWTHNIDITISFFIIVVLQRIWHRLHLHFPIQRLPDPTQLPEIPENRNIARLNNFEIAKLWDVDCVLRNEYLKNQYIPVKSICLKSTRSVTRGAKVLASMPLDVVTAKWVRCLNVAARSCALATVTWNIRRKPYVPRKLHYLNAHFIYWQIKLTFKWRRFLLTQEE